MLVEEIVDKIISVLYDRNGFDDWWDDLEDEIRAEIRNELLEAVNEMFFLD